MYRPQNISVPGPGDFHRHLQATIDRSGIRTLQESGVRIQSQSRFLLFRPVAFLAMLHRTAAEPAFRRIPVVLRTEVRALAVKANMKSDAAATRRTCLIGRVSKSGVQPNRNIRETGFSRCQIRKIPVFVSAFSLSRRERTPCGLNKIGGTCSGWSWRARNRSHAQTDNWLSIYVPSGLVSVGRRSCFMPFIRFILGAIGRAKEQRQWSADRTGQILDHPCGTRGNRPSLP